jgi:hypothetical protein
MRKFIAAIILTGLVGHAFAQTQPAVEQSHNNKAYVAPDAAHATEASVGNLTPLYVGAGVVGAAVIASAINGGGDGRHDPAGGGGGTSGTTGTK